MVVTVVMTTYSPGQPHTRFDYAIRCIQSLRQLNSPEMFRLLLADDGTEGGEKLLQTIVNQWSGQYVSFITGPHNGIGASLNRALATIGDVPWVYTTDDWLLTDYLDLTLPLWLLTQGYDIVRLGPIHPNLMCWVKFEHPHGWWLDITQNGHGYIFATRPFLASPGFVAKFGPFDEGLNAYETERLFSEHFNRLGGRAAAINLAGPWSHIGEYEVGEHTPGDLFQMEKAAPIW